MPLEVIYPYPRCLTAEQIAPDAMVFADRQDLIRSLKRDYSGGAIAELGVAWGDFSRMVLDELKPRLFDAYDLFELHNFPIVWGQSTAERLCGATHAEYFAQRFDGEIKTGRLRMMIGNCRDNLPEQPDQFYDIIYIDADHMLDAVHQDAALASAKLKPDGILIFNDYIMWDYATSTPYGVVQVVNQMCVEEGWKVTHFALECGMWCDIAISRKPRRRLVRRLVAHLLR